MRVIPVLDLLGGVVVRGIGGRRHEYRPVASVLTHSARPLEVASAFREQLGLTTLYIADLDGIAQHQPDVSFLGTLRDAGFEVWIDAGVRSVADVTRQLDAGAAQVIIGLETLSGPRMLATLGDEFGWPRMIFSLDLNHGQPLTTPSLWLDPTPQGIARTAFASGARQMIVLDLASVGEAAGPSTLALCSQIRDALPDFRLITGGGVRDAGDLCCLQSLGVWGVLLSTSLHAGVIGHDEILRLQEESDPA
jgi:phosphoribosylformimino-5-aminoimidazole carboxamide ribotide isomerase